MRVPEVPRVPVHPGSAVLASPGPRTAQNECQHEAVTYQEDLLQPQKKKTGSDGLKCREMEPLDSEGPSRHQHRATQRTAVAQALTEHTRRPAHRRQCLQSHPREMNVPNRPCAPTENTQDIQEHRDKHTGLGRSG